MGQQQDNNKYINDNIFLIHFIRKVIDNICEHGDHNVYDCHLTINDNINDNYNNKNKVGQRYVSKSSL